MIVTAVGNQKGGVGKTSTVLGLAAALQALGRQVCVLDMDPQANATSTLEVGSERDMLDVLMADRPGLIGEAVAATAWPGEPVIDAVASSRRLARFETEGGLSAAEQRLRDAMHGAGLDRAYDDLLIDLPPSLGRLTLNGLLAADRVIVVTEPAKYSVAAVERFLETAAEVQARVSLNPSLRVAGIVVNKFDARAGEDRYQVQALQSAFGDLVRLPLLPMRSAVKDAASANQPVGTLATAPAKVMAHLYEEHAAWMIEEGRN